MTLLTATLALTFVSWVLAVSDAPTHWLRLITLREPPREFLAALLGCQVCLGFWASIVLWWFVPMSTVTWLAVNGGHLVVASLTGGRETRTDTGQMAT